MTAIAVSNLSVWVNWQMSCGSYRTYIRHWFDARPLLVPRCDCGTFTDCRECYFRRGYVILGVVISGLIISIHTDRILLKLM